METISIIIFYLSAFIIFTSMIGYPLLMRLVDKVLKPKKIRKDYDHKPSVTVLISAHNEEKVIEKKLDNLLEQKYPADRIKFLVASDYSDDKTNEIVNDYISNHPDHDIRLYVVKKRMGKTNAQNEAVKTIDTEFTVMTDANSMLDKYAVSELMAAFVSEKVGYVCGNLSIVNDDESHTSKSEKSYWDSDKRVKDIESRLQTITGGNGALYACRTSEYMVFDPIISHDTWMPLHFALDGMVAYMNPDARVYEKAGTSIGDEFSRKVRMNRRMLDRIMPDLRILNIFRYRWFTICWLGHRSCRYLLWVSHLLILLSNIYLASVSSFYLFVLIFHILFYLLAVLQFIFKTDNRYFRMIYYYVITIIAQWVGFYKVITGQAKPFWDKAESTRS